MGNAGRSALVARRVLVATAAGVVLFALQHVAVQTTAGQLLDERWMSAVRDANETVSAFATGALATVSPFLAIAVLALALTIAGIRRDAVGALHAITVVVVSNVVSQVLKHTVFDRPMLTDVISHTPNSLPSGHTTLAVSLVAAVVAVSPRAAAPLVAIGGLTWAGAAALGTIVAGWHRPSDIVAALLVIVVVDQCARAAFRSRPPRVTGAGGRTRPAHTRRRVQSPTRV